MTITIDNGFLGYDWATALEINQILESYVCVLKIVDLEALALPNKIEKKVVEKKKVEKKKVEKKKEIKKRLPKEKKNISLVVEEIIKHITEIDKI